MRPGRALALALGLAFLAALLAEASRAAAWVPPSPGARQTTFVITPPQTVYPLPDRFVLAGTESAFVRGRRLVPGHDYFLDAVAGEFRLNAPLAPGDSVQLFYRALLVPPQTANGVLVPAAITPEAAARARAGPDTSFASPEAGGPSAMTRAGVPAAGAASSGGAELNLTGNKTVAVDFGNTRDVALRQSLDLNATGRIAPGVDVIAVLSDRNTPITGDGSTTELRELDKILLEVKGEHAGGALGDVSLRQDRGSFARYGRELSGVTARGQGGDVEGVATLAGVKGVFVSRQFQGTEAVQGPYVLPDDAGRTGISIVAGSEVVWLDGVRMVRGETADYSMDYDRGTLTFSARRLISSASRIAIDYQVALTEYRRNVSSFAGGWTRKNVQAWGQVFREADSRYRPLHTTLTEEDQFVLAQAGDDPSLALGNGIAPGPGDYDAFTDTSGTTRFVFAGVGLGAFSLSFTGVGAGQGDYAESTVVQGRRTFRFVGTGLGDIAIGRPLPLPNALDVVNGGLSATPWSWARLDAELAGSRYDANTYSSLDDEGRNGAAARLGADLEGPVELFGRGLGRIGLSAGMRRFDEAYRSPGRLDPAFYEEEWGVNANRTLKAQDRKAGALTWKPRTPLSFAAEYAELSADSGFFARRRSAGGTLTGTVNGAARIDRVDNRQEGSPYRDEGYRDKLVAQAGYAGWSVLTPQASLDFEARVPPAVSDSAATRYQQWDAGVTAPRVGPFELSGGYGYRKDYSLTGETWNALTHAGRVRTALSGQLGAGITAAVGFEQRRQEPEAPGAPPALTSDAGYTRLRQTLGQRGGEHAFALEWTNEAEEIRRRETRFVGFGAGAFDSLGNFVGQGDYTVIQVATGTFRRLVKTSGSYRAELRPNGWFPDSSAWAGRTQDARAAVLVQASLGRRGSFELADLFYTPKRILADSAVAFGSYLIRPEVEFGTRTKFASFLFRVERRSTADRQFEGQSTLRDEWIEEGRWRARPDPHWLGEVTGRLGQANSEQSVQAFPSVRRRLVSQGVLGELTFLPSPDWRFGVVTSFDQADVEEDGLLASRVWRAGPRLVYQRGGKFRGELLVRGAAIEGGAVPVLVPSGFPTFPDRFDYTLETSLRVRERANLILSANGRKRDGASFVQSGRVELRAYF